MIRVNILDPRRWGSAIRLLHAFHRESPYREIPATDDAIKAMLRKTTSANGITLLACDDNRAVGILGALISPFWFAPRVLFAQELFWWVDEEARGNGVGRMLLARFEEEMRQREISYITMMSLNDRRADSTYSASSYMLAETNYLKKLE